jgi:hypothetical protein
MLDPFKLQRRLLRAILSIGGRLLKAACKAIWYGPYGRQDRTGNTLHHPMRTIAGAIADFFRR